ncbi:MAG: UMP kinase [Candidatus Aenigmarchaeota archaeon]|nr:UMP kinase [Candidatus Aenigmarchaeota archaeon]
MKIVIKIGGSLAITGSGPDEDYVKKLLPVIREIKKRHKIVFVIGGGRLIRNYYSSLASFNMSDAEKESILIELLRANVKFFSLLLEMKPIFTMEDLKKNKFGVIGGIKPGTSTDANAAYAASLIKAGMLIKMTNVNGIYDKDPNKYDNAKKLDEVKFSELKNYSVKGRPVSYGILDPTAMKIITRNKITTYVIDGRQPENLLKVVRGGKIGTVIH